MVGRWHPDHGVPDPVGGPGASLRSGVGGGVGVGKPGVIAAAEAHSATDRRVRVSYRFVSALATTWIAPGAYPSQMWNGKPTAAPTRA